MIQIFPRILLIDMNSFFASVEQQANPFLRGKPVGVCASLHQTSCLIAASKEAKALGIKTGTLVYQAKKICPKIILLPSEPEKYSEVNRRIVKIFRDYTDRLEVYSIDEAFLEIDELRINGLRISNSLIRNPKSANPIIIGAEIKERIKQEVGEWLTCSVGLAQNKFMAKLAADMPPASAQGYGGSAEALCEGGKPDGLSIIWSREQLREVYQGKQLRDLWGINRGWERRLAKIGITSPLQLLDYPAQNLISLFGKPGYYLWQRVNGYEVDKINPCGYTFNGSAARIGKRLASSVKTIPHLMRDLTQDPRLQYLTLTSGMGQETHNAVEQTIRAAPTNNDPPKSFGHSWVLNFRTTDKERLKPVILRLAEKAARRMRKEGFQAYGFYIFIRMVDGSFIAKSKKLKFAINTGLELYEQAMLLLDSELCHRLLSTIPAENSYKLSGDLSRGFGKIPDYLANPRLGDGNGFPAPVMHIAVGFRDLVKYSEQLELNFGLTDYGLNPQSAIRNKLIDQLDAINDKYGEFTVRSGLLTRTSDFAPDAIAFGK